MPHSIRLKDHWTTTELAEGVVRHARRFGAPRITNETVWLLGEASGPGSVLINGSLAGTFEGAFEVEISALLKPRNEAWIDVQGTIDSVRLELRS